MEQFVLDNLISKIPTLKIIFGHRTIRRFKKDEEFSVSHKEIIERAAQRAATSCSGQMYSFIEVNDTDIRATIYEICGKQVMIKDAALFYVVIADLHRLDALVKKVGKDCTLGPISGSLIAACDASLAAQNLVLAAESLGYGTAYLGTCGDRPEEIAKILKLPNRTLPIFGIAIGTPIEDPPLRPRISRDLIFHRNIYQQLDDIKLEETISNMSFILDKEKYYLKYGKNENYTWKDHLYQKFGGIWLRDIEKIRKKAIFNKMINK